MSPKFGSPYKMNRMPHAGHEHLGRKGIILVNPDEVDQRYAVSAMLSSRPTNGLANAARRSLGWLELAACIILLRSGFVS